MCVFRFALVFVFVFVFPCVLCVCVCVCACVGQCEHVQVYRLQKSKTITAVETNLLSIKPFYYGYLNENMYFGNENN